VAFHPEKALVRYVLLLRDFLRQHGKFTPALLRIADIDGAHFDQGHVFSQPPAVAAIPARRSEVRFTHS
jgi:hypothetical protein